MTEIKLPIDPPLTTMEARVLGALMEKQLTTPDAYPLTLNSLVLACNQKTSREPVSNYSGGEIQHCVRLLAEKKLIDVDHGARAERYRERLGRVLGADQAIQALLNVMLLRGPQTVHELLTRTQRMCEFENDQKVEETLVHLCEKFTPLVQRVPRQTGQREDRFVHLLSGAPDVSAIAAMRSESRAAVSTIESSELEARVSMLEQQLAELEKKLAELTAR